MAYYDHERDNKRTLCRAREGRKFLGVCQGLADYFMWDVTLVRLCFLLPAILPGVTMLGATGLYLLLAFIFPAQDDYYE